jgi:hypothetical protein
VMARVERLITPGPTLPRGVRYSIVIFSITLTSSAPLLWLIPH